MVVPLFSHSRKTNLRRPLLDGRMLEEQSGRSRRLREVLRARRKELGWSLQRVADKIAEDMGLERLSGEGVRQWERFDTHPPINKYASWCRVLGLRLEVQVLDGSSDRVMVLVRPETAHLIRGIDMASMADRRMIQQMMIRMGILD